MLVDRFGPRRVYTWLLAFACVPCLAIAFSNHFWQLAICRLLISCVGAGFVVGIRMVAEWFDASEIGTAEGIYGGLGNFGMAAATFGLPLLALLFSPQTWLALGHGHQRVALFGLGVCFLRESGRRSAGQGIQATQKKRRTRSHHQRRRWPDWSSCRCRWCYAWV